MDIKYYIALARVVLITAVILFLIFRKNEAVTDFLTSKEFKQLIKCIILIVEEIYKTMSGDEKMAKAIEMLTQYIPEYIRKYITMDDLREAIQAVFDMIVEQVDGHNVPQNKEI